MSDVKLGELLPDGARRDAVHIAVLPAVALHNMNPSDPVAYTNGSAIQPIGENDFWGRTPLPPVGIVDPFLADPVRTGQRFYIFLFPGTVTGMRHEWACPAVDGDKQPSAPNVPFKGPVPADAKAQARAWITHMADGIGYTYERLMQIADDYAVTGDCTRDDSERYKEFDWDEFWVRYEIIRNGDKPRVGGAPFTCSC